MAKKPQPKALTGGREFHHSLQDHWLKTAEGKVSVERRFAGVGGQRGCIDIFVDPGGGLVAMAEILGSDWDRMATTAVRRNVRRQAGKICGYIESQLSEGKEVSAAVIFPRRPASKARLELIEALFEGCGIQVVWHDEAIETSAGAALPSANRQPGAPHAAANPSSVSRLFRAALSDLRAAELLRMQLADADRQVLKLIDDAAELILKAVLTDQGIDTEGRPFPWLVNACRTTTQLPRELDAMHRLRNRVKHGGMPAPKEDVASAYRAVIAFAGLLHAQADKAMAYCAGCHEKVPSLLARAVRVPGRGGDRTAVRGWCFVCDERTYRIVQR